MSATSTSGLSVNYCCELSKLNKVAFFFCSGPHWKHFFSVTMSKQNGPITADLRDTNVGGKCFSKLLRVCSCRVSHRTFTSCHVLMHHVLYTPFPPKKWRCHDSKLFSFSFIIKTQCLILRCKQRCKSPFFQPFHLHFHIFGWNFLLRLGFNYFQPVLYWISKREGAFWTKSKNTIR